MKLLPVDSAKARALIAQLLREHLLPVENGVEDGAANVASLRTLGRGVAQAAQGVAMVPFYPREFGAKGDGATDDTAAVLACRRAAHAVGGRGIIQFDVGEYKIQPEAFAEAGGLRSLIIRGAGMERTTIRPYVDGAPGMVFSCLSRHIEISDLSVVGPGYDVGTGDGILFDPSGGAPPLGGASFYLYLHDLRIEGFGGRGIYAPQSWHAEFDRIAINGCGHNLFDLNGGNTAVLTRCYAEEPRPGRCGFRIHGPAITMISCNGINGSADRDRLHYWGIFGTEIAGSPESPLYLVWEPEHYYAKGEIAITNGEEWECVTAGTSGASGPGTSAAHLGSRDVTDGTAHWRHLGEADTVEASVATQPCAVSMIGCNVEDAAVGIRCKVNASFSFEGGSFSAYKDRAAGVIAALWDKCGNANRNSEISATTMITMFGEGAGDWESGYKWHTIGAPTSLPIFRGGRDLVDPSMQTFLCRQYGTTYKAPALESKCLGYGGAHLLTDRFATVGPIGAVQGTLATEAVGGDGKHQIKSAGEAYSTVDTNIASVFLFEPTAGMAAYDFRMLDVYPLPTLLDGSQISIIIRNRTGGALSGTIVFGSDPGFGYGYALASAAELPADGYEICYRFQARNDGRNGYGTMHEIGRSTTPATPAPA